MTHPTNNVPRVHPASPLVMPLIANAVAVAYSIALVKTPVRFVRDSMLAKLSGFLRYIADKSARGVYTALGSAVNNKLTRRISPSVSLLDEKIENICTVSGRWAGNVLSLPGTAAFYLVAAAYASVVAIAAVVVLIAKAVLVTVCNICLAAIRESYKETVLETKKEAAAYNNMAAKAAFMLLQALWKFPVHGVIIPAVVLTINTFIKTLSVLAAPILAPVYMLSSVLELDNRFNIYNYENGVGLLHGFIQDVIEKKYNYTQSAWNRLAEEATTRGIDKTNTADPEQAPTKLASITVVLGAQPGKVASA